ncbi:hypothetical protein PVAP13_9KG043229 [Panicum virgatum]|uniref:Uncharacterized protein n=1 Tax=Panicum virgatum TaxID=38727 RepID=A0A8T0NB56_PANVG|nr:hypothetical protein PVAP13_9KG043229 [Panicum virgatum]
MARAYDKLVKQRAFRRGELVLVLRRPIVVTHKTKGKFEPKWEGPYIIEQAYDGGAYQLVDHQGARPCPPINGRILSLCFDGSSVAHQCGMASSCETLRPDRLAPQQ